MKRTNIHIFAAIALLLGLAACNSVTKQASCARRGGKADPPSSPPRADPVDSHRRHPCPGGRKLGGCAERGSPWTALREGITTTPSTADPTSVNADSRDCTTE